MARRRDGYYYSETRSAHKERTIHGFWPGVLRVVDVVWMVATVVCALLLLMGLLAGSVSPTRMTLFAFAGLGYPIIYLLNLACALWWAVRWRWWFFVSAAVLLLGLGAISRHYQVTIFKNPADVTYEQNDLVVVSYNVKGFSTVEELTVRQEADSVAHWFNGRDANVVCLQEAYFPSSFSFEIFKDSLANFKYGFFENTIDQSEEANSIAGLAILSSYPIVEHGILWGDSLRVGSVWADVKVGRDTLRVYNVHLKSTGVTPADRNRTLSVNIVDDSLAGKNISSIVAKMSDNYKLRAKEVAEISRGISGSEHPVVVCGDFNDVPTSHTYKRLRADALQDSFLERGRGAGYTFKGFRELFRIDYILSSEDYFEVKEYDSPELPYSDHNPVISRLGVDAK